MPLDKLAMAAPVRPDESSGDGDAWRASLVPSPSSVLFLLVLALAGPVRARLAHSSFDVARLGRSISPPVRSKILDRLGRACVVKDGQTGGNLFLCWTVDRNVSL